MRFRDRSLPGPERAGFLVVALMALAAPALAAGSGIEVEGPWLRYLPANRPAAGYFTLRNTSPRAVDLVGASSPACGSLMLHESSNTGGMAQMKAVDAVPVPAGGSVSFAPGGYHLMCLQLSAKVKPGQAVPVTLRFRDGTAMTTSFPVRGPRGK